MHTNTPTESGLTRRQVRLERINASGRPAVPLFYHNTTGRASARSLRRNRRIAMFKSEGWKSGTYIDDITGMTRVKPRRIMRPCDATVIVRGSGDVWRGNFNRLSNGVLTYHNS